MSSSRDAAHRPRTSRSRSPLSPVKRTREDGDDYNHDSSRRVRTRHHDGSSRRHRDEETPRSHRDDHHHRHHRHSDRDRSSRHHHHHKPSSSSTKPTTAPPKDLPFSSRPLSYKTDLEQFRPVLARYLDVQKQRDMYEMDEREVRGRWKSFVGKWNAGELAQGWYDPDVFATAVLEDQAARAEAERNGVVAVRVNNDSGSAGREESRQQKQGGSARPDSPARRQDSPEGSESSSGDGYGPGRSGSRDDRAGQRHDRQHPLTSNNDPDSNEDDDEDYGPGLPGTTTTTTTSSSNPARSHGPGIPSLQDLALRREASAEAAARDREFTQTQLRADRKADRTAERERLDELAGGRPDPGSHERKLEKKREVTDKMRAFRDNKSPGPDAVDDSELMGGGADGGDLAEYKKQKAAEQRRKTDREIRREEEARARDEERAERLRRYKEKEDRTMDVLREIARQRFG